jgi:transcription elongation factor GreB
MNKAFTKETEAPEEPPEFVDALPPGMKNYMTPEGAKRLHEERRHLHDIERPKLLADKADGPSKKRLREIDQRLLFIGKRLRITEVVDPSRQKNHAQVFFGASVTYADGAGAEHTVRIVGVDEARQELGEVSWVSPIARALNGAGPGDIVKLSSPSGIEEIEILKIDYKTPAST